MRVSIVGCDVVFSGVVDSIEQEKHAIWYAKHIDGVADVYFVYQSYQINFIPRAFSQN